MGVAKVDEEAFAGLPRAMPIHPLIKDAMLQEGTAGGRRRTDEGLPPGVGSQVWGLLSRL
jgi:hypothetical protein